MSNAAAICQRSSDRHGFVQPNRSATDVLRSGWTSTRRAGLFLFPTSSRSIGSSSLLFPPFHWQKPVWIFCTTNRQSLRRPCRGPLQISSSPAVKGQTCSGCAGQIALPQRRHLRIRKSASPRLDCPPPPVSSRRSVALRAAAQNRRARRVTISNSSPNIPLAVLPIRQACRGKTCSSRLGEITNRSSFNVRAASACTSGRTTCPATCSSEWTQIRTTASLATRVPNLLRRILFPVAGNRFPRAKSRLKAC